jgi:hypothetical protein
VHDVSAFLGVPVGTLSGHDLPVVDVPRPTRPRFVVQPGQTSLCVPGPPNGHRRAGYPDPVGDLRSRHPSAASSTIRTRCATPARTELERVSRNSSSRSPARNGRAAAGRFGTASSQPPNRESTNDARH